MVNNATVIDGKEYQKEKLKEIIMTSKKPLVVKNMIDGWQASKWSIDEFTQLFGAVRTKFKLYRKDLTSPSCKKRKMEDNSEVSVMETDCTYEHGTFKDFHDWLIQRKEETNPLCRYPRDEYWCYADYNHMPDLFDDVTVMNCVDWSIFGFDGRNGVQSTIWVGSENSFTPCHQDTYGLNLVAQIDGSKTWLLVPPDKTNLMRPMRIPYEESSIFTNLTGDNVEKIDGCIKVNLQPKEVLLVPKHWWHYVESTTPSISINTWIELESDKDDRIHESLTQTLVYAFKEACSSSDDSWLNPGQDLPSSLEECVHYVQLLMKERYGAIKSESDGQTLNEEDLLNCLCEKEVLEKLTESLSRRLGYRKN